MKADAADNPSSAITCGWNVNWIYGNIIIDRDRFGQDRKFGISVAGGQIVFGVSGNRTGDFTICGTSDVLDGRWHHIAVQRRRSDGYMWLYVDGSLEAQSDGPDGDISYPDNGVPCGDCCNGPCDFSDPYLVFGAEKHDYDRNSYPSDSGYLDQVRLSTVLRYSGNFTPPTQPFTPDNAIAALYHFDEGAGNAILDSPTRLADPATASGAWGQPCRSDLDNRDAVPSGGRCRRQRLRGRCRLVAGTVGVRQFGRRGGCEQRRYRRRRRPIDSAAQLRG